MNDVSLGDGLEVLIDYRGKTPAKLGSSFTESGIPVASALLVKDGRLDLSGARYVDDETARRWMGVSTARGDVLLTSEAPLGRVARVPSDAPLVLGQRLFGLRGKPGILDTGYLYYALQSTPVQASLRGHATGTTVLGIRQAALRTVRIPAPSVDDQRAIAEVLGALDDKIAANDHVIRMSDDLAGALVHRASVDGQRLPLRDLANLHYGKALPASQRVEGAITVFGSGGRTGIHSTSLVERPGIVIGRKGTVGAIYWADGPHWPIDTTFYVEPHGPVSSEILYYAMRRLRLSELNSDSAVPGLNRDEAYAQIVEIPQDSARSMLSTRVRELLLLMASRRSESNAIATTRDELLPLLMSGKVRVRDAEKRVEEVL